MITTPAETLSLALALVAILSVGSTQLRGNIFAYAVQTAMLSIITAQYAIQRSEPQLLIVAIALFLLKTLGVSLFLNFLIKKVNVQRDSSNFIATPVAMHICLAFLALSYILSISLPPPPMGGAGWPTATASFSMLCTGLMLMMTRRIALGQIIGFLILENGIYLFGLAHTHGMPMLIEMGILLDVLAGVMIAGLLAFRIKKNFEHIDVTKLAELKE